MKNINLSNLILIIAIFGIGAYGWYTYSNPVLLINWETKTELNVAGYRVMRRSDSQEQFEQVSYEIIPPSADPVLGGKYSYEDRGVKTGQTYEYMLEEIDSSGAITQYGPLLATVESTLWATGLSITILIGGAFLLNKKS